MRAVLLILTLTAAPAAAQPAAAPATLEAVTACAAEADDARRLACYDEAVGRLDTAMRTGEVVAVERDDLETIERESFGFSLPSLPRLFGAGEPGQARDVVSENEMEIARVAHSGAGRAVFTMTNGQVWTQIDTNSTRRVRSGGKVTIRRAALGSFLMSVEAGGPAIRVRRQE